MAMRDNADLVKNDGMEGVVGGVGGDGINEGTDCWVDCQSCVSARATISTLPQVGMLVPTDGRQVPDPLLRSPQVHW